MCQSQDNGRSRSGVERDRDLVPLLQGLSRRLDMNAVGNIRDVRRELQRLLCEGRLGTPVTQSSPYEPLEFAGPMRSIAEDARLSAQQQVAQPPAKRPREKKAPEQRTESPKALIEAMSPSELSCYISAQLIFHTAFDLHLEKRRPLKSNGAPHGSDK